MINTIVIITVVLAFNIELKRNTTAPWVYYKLTYWDEQLKKYVTENDKELEYEDIQSLNEAEQKFIEMLEDLYGNTKKRRKNK